MPLYRRSIFRWDRQNPLHRMLGVADVSLGCRTGRHSALHGYRSGVGARICLRRNDHPHLGVVGSHDERQHPRLPSRSPTVTTTSSAWTSTPRAGSLGALFLTTTGRTCGRRRLRICRPRRAMSHSRASKTTEFTGINTAGDTTGWTNDFGEGNGLRSVPGISLKNGTYTEIQPLDGVNGATTGGNAINDTDTVAGRSSTAERRDPRVHLEVEQDDDRLRYARRLRQRGTRLEMLRTRRPGMPMSRRGRAMPSATRPESSTDLGTLGGSESVGNGLNNSGVVVGWADTVSGRQDAAMWTGMTITDLGAKLERRTFLARQTTSPTPARSSVTPTRADGSQFGWVYLNGAMINLNRNTMTSDARICG